MTKNHNRKIRVCHVYKTYLCDTVGGLERVIEQICRQVDQNLVTNRILSLGGASSHSAVVRSEAEVRRFPVTFDYASCPVSLRMFLAFKKETAWADIIHYHFPWPFADFLHIIARPRKPSIITYHSDILRQRRLKAIYKPLMRRFLAAVQRIVVTSPKYLESSIDLLPYHDKIGVIPISIDERDYPKVNNERLHYWERTLGRDFFLFVGVLRYYKGLHVLLDAARGFTGRVIIVGSGPMERELRHKIIRKNINNVTLLGFLDEVDKRALLRLCRAVVFPSHLRTEAFGVTLVEGAMAAKPLISTEIGTGTSYVNQDGETGIVVPPSNPDALREAMVRLTEPVLANAMGEAARKRYEQLFCAPRMGREYYAVYRDVLGRDE